MTLEKDVAVIWRCNRLRSPGPDARCAAIGDTRSWSKNLRLAFEPSIDFEPPAKRTWLPNGYEDMVCFRRSFCLLIEERRPDRRIFEEREAK